jgi:hypothetical protein
MSTFKEIVYMCSDQLKLSSDDAFFTNDHILYLLKKYRGLLLSQKYKDVRKEIPESNYQTICLSLIQVPALTDEPCEDGLLLRSKDKIPSLMAVGITEIYPVDYYVGDITFVSRERMKYVGHNRWLQNIIYCSIAPDGYLYLKSLNPQFLYLENIRMTGIFEDIDAVEKLSCGGSEASCDILDRRFPMEEALIPQLIETVVKFMTSGLYKPEDTENNANDDLSTMMSFIRNNMKSNLQKQIEG